VGHRPVCVDAWFLLRMINISRPVCGTQTGLCKMPVFSSENDPYFPDRSVERRPVCVKYSILIEITNIFTDRSGFHRPVWENILASDLNFSRPVWVPQTGLWKCWGKSMPHDLARNRFSCKYIDRSGALYTGLDRCKKNPRPVWSQM